MPIFDYETVVRARFACQAGGEVSCRSCPERCSSTQFYDISSDLNRWLELMLSRLVTDEEFLSLIS